MSLGVRATLVAILHVIIVGEAGAVVDIGLRAVLGCAGNVVAAYAVILIILSRANVGSDKRVVELLERYFVRPE